PPVYVIATVHAFGGAFTSSAGWKTGEADRSLFRFVTLRPGFCAMFIAAVIVSVGNTVPAALGARLNSFPQLELSPATPPAEWMHCSRMSASVLISVVGSVAPPGSV